MSHREIIEDSIKRIASDRVSGSRELTLLAIQSIAELVSKGKFASPARLIEGVHEACTKIARARVSMPSIQNRTQRIESDVMSIETSGLRLDEVRRHCLKIIKGEMDRINKDTALIAEHCEPLVAGKRIMTYSWSSTILEVLGKVAPRGRILLSEGRPLFEGRRMMFEVARMGFQVTMFTDASLGYFVKQADVVLVGADAVLRGGYLVNKIGTYLLAVAARYSKVPFYSACETSKFSRLSPDDYVLEEKSTEEVLSAAPEGVSVRNLYFDVTSPGLITGYITEKGMLRPKQIKAGM